MVRSLKIINQVIWPPIITTLLYVFIFGLAIGSRIPSVQGVSYAQFLIPGLIMLQVIERCFTNQLDHGGWIQKLREMIPSYGESLITNTALCKKVRADSAAALNIVNL